MVWQKSLNADLEKTKDETPEGRSDFRLQQSQENDAIDSKYGFVRYKGKDEKVGWLLNIHPTEILDEDKRLISAVDYYFIQEDGSRFKVSLPYSPYFYVMTRKEHIHDVSTYLMKKFSGLLSSVKPLMKEDLDLDNHLIGLKQVFLKLSFITVSDLTKVRQKILAAVKRNRESNKSKTVYAEMLQAYSVDDGDENQKKLQDQMQNLIDIREYDVPYHIRVSIDMKIFVGHWYSVTCGLGPPSIVFRKDILVWPDCTVLAYDIETTKLPLKFPDSSSDQIMMISYMIDGQGYLITNREIISEDVEDFEYTPRPEFEGFFTVFNEPDEISLIQRFFDHILEIRPHIFVTYNGDLFDWPFVEARAAFHGLNMHREIGFSVNNTGNYACRPAIHMDCLCWVKRDSYLPVGSHNLKAVAKAKLHYNPVEMDPEDMCLMAAEQPQVLSNYSVSDAVATYYLYIKYIHPFIFALCSIIPMEPDEVLRKGSGTLCEALLMVEAYHANIIYPNKQESVLNKMTSDGHVLDQETYVGGHVEAIESGVFRADIPCRFRLVPEAFQKLINSIDSTVKFCIEVEEKIPLDEVTNYEEVVSDIKEKLSELRDTPCRLENPMIYHLDVGAMYPNIILTNRLQPSAMVDERVCAACDFNKPGSRCQRRMNWMWRGELIPASRSEFHRIQQQLETEKFPPQFPGGPHRAFHQLPREEQAAVEKKRLQEYCRRAYKKTHTTRTEERWQTVCQRENNFYVNTVLSFRDRRYEYKALARLSKKELADAQKKGDASEIKAANSQAILYDSLQLAHKCILNSFYGYVMRKGSRWYSMEMAGIVCYTGATIITRAREIVEQIGRPLELDTDGIWCILPSSFPENYVIKTSSSKKPKVTISYPGAILNVMVRDHYTNDQYHDLVNSDTLEYSVRSENSIFFEVDGPYLAMVLPASKEEGKKLKKRYAVFNFDGSLAELKGFEVKRRGELQLIKIFQSSVFEAFLKGSNLESCYASVAKVADCWLDVLYNKAAFMADNELFDLIAENRSMSKKLEEYGAQKSTSISTAKRLAEFLGDEMIKDAGLSCRYIISRKPEGAPVTERAIPLAIFQAEPSVKHHYLRRWLKDSSLTEFDIRNILDWNYYIERLSGAIQKIVTIPAALQGVPNPVPRISHPDWLHKKVLERTDTLKQRRITDMFLSMSKKTRPDVATESVSERPAHEVVDIEDMESPPEPRKPPVPVSHKRKRNPGQEEFEDSSMNKIWRDVLGPPPVLSKDTLGVWISFQKKKWAFQHLQRSGQSKRVCRDPVSAPASNREPAGRVMRSGGTSTIGGFLRKAHRTLLDVPWQIIQLAETTKPGLFRAWALVGHDLHMVKIIVPRIFYVNQKTAKPEEGGGGIWQKSNKMLPRSYPVYNLYEYVVPEEFFVEHSNELVADLSMPDIEGIYETQVPLEFRALVQLGCICVVDKSLVRTETDTFELTQLKFKTVAQYKYLEGNVLKLIYFYQHKVNLKSVYGLFVPISKKAYVFVLDTVRSNQMPNLNSLYNSELNTKVNDGTVRVDDLPESNYSFDIKFETEARQIHRQIQRVLQLYQEERKGPTYIAVQSLYDFLTLHSLIPAFGEFPLVPIHIVDSDTLYNVLDWQRIGARTMIKHYLDLKETLYVSLEQSRYFHVPVGNLPKDTTAFGNDLFYARHLQKQNIVLWCSPLGRPDLGGHEYDDSRFIANVEDASSTSEINHPGTYNTYCIEIALSSLAVNAIAEAHHINELEGTSSSIAFDAAPQASLQDIFGKAESSLTRYDESAQCASAFKALKTMVLGCLHDVSHYQNKFADFQVMHFYRWIKNPNSLLYDPVLKKILNTVMHKLFMHLICEFKRLGSIIICADFNQIIICTKKKTLEDALSYVQYIIDSIQEKVLFHFIGFEIKRGWEFLMWMDKINFAGVDIKLPEDISQCDDVTGVSDKTTGNRVDLQLSGETDEAVGSVVNSNWYIANYLPTWAGCRDTFIALIGAYIAAIYGKQMAESGQFTPGNTPMRQKSDSQLIPKAQQLPEACLEYAQQLVSDVVTQKLFFLTQKIYKKGLEDTYEDSAINQHRSLVVYPKSNSSPALAFVKTVCRVLMLDQNVTEQVGKLRRDLLKLINVGEFSPEAVWQDPGYSYVLQEVICKYCNSCRSIDLCRDQNHKLKDDKMVIFCPACKLNYDTADIEDTVINQVHSYCISYVLQDVQCDRCSQVKQPNMTRHCDCGGRFKTMIKAEDFTLRMKVVLSIADSFSMFLLKETVEWIAQHNPTLV